MPVESAADRAVFFDPDEFGTGVVYQPPSVGVMAAASAIWNRPGGMGRLSSTEVASDDHLFIVQRSEVPSPVPAGFITVTATGERFRIIHEPEASQDGALWLLSAAPAA